jgi:hypothetical protein
VSDKMWSLDDIAEENKREALDKAFPSHQDYSGDSPTNEDK